MDNIFQTQISNKYNQITYDIVINRKPSQIPISIDRELLYMGCFVGLDGPNNRVTYEFFSEKNAKKAEDFFNSLWLEENLR